MLRPRLYRYVVSLAVIMAAGACATKEIRDNDFDSDKTTDGGLTDAQGINPDAPSIGNNTNTKTVELKGTTYAPNGDLKLAGVLVYWTRSEPEPIPEGAYCDTCLELPEGTFTTSGPDGSFTLKVPVDQEIVIVTQKGQFQRVRSEQFSEDDTKFDKELTTLPGRTSKTKGDVAPKIGIVTGTYDKIDETLAELGVEDLDTISKSDLADVDKLKEFHIIMFPCDMVGGDNSCGNPKAQEPDVQAALRDFTQAGGKIYASDYSYEYVNQAFPGFITFAGSGEPGTGCVGSYTSTGAYDDADMAAWMEAIGEDSVEFHGNYSQIEQVNAVEGPNEKGETVSLMPKVWATSVTKINYSGDVIDDNFNRPATVSIPYGCGRALFSTFHTESDPEATAQKKALLYVLLEVSACINPDGDIH